MRLLKDFTFKRLYHYLFLSLSHLPMSGRSRWRLVKMGGVDIKGRCFIYSDVSFDTVCPERIHVGKGVTITSGTKILTHYFSTAYGGRIFRQGDVYIEDDVFIGLNTIICNSVTIGKGAIIGAGSIVTKDIPEYQVWAGNPARFIKDRVH